MQEIEFLEQNNLIWKKHSLLANINKECFLVLKIEKLGLYLNHSWKIKLSMLIYNRVDWSGVMLELEENIKVLQELNEKLNEIRDSLWHRKF